MFRKCTVSYVRTPLLTFPSSGRLLLCLIPSPDSDPLHCVKWHPKNPDVLAVASESTVFILSIPEVSNYFAGETITQADLARVGQCFSIPSVSDSVLSVL